MSAGNNGTLHVASGPGRIIVCPGRWDIISVTINKVQHYKMGTTQEHLMNVNLHPPPIITSNFTEACTLKISNYSLDPVSID